MSPKFARLMATTIQPLRVLFIDDDEMALTMTQLQLLKAGMHMAATSDALEAVGIMATQELDLVLLDSVMPTIDGIEFLHLMRSLQLNFPVVFLTGHGTEQLQELVREFNVLDILDKQAHRMELPQRLRALHSDYNNRKFTRQSDFGGHREAS